MRVTQAACKSCGVDLLWLDGFSRLPVEADPRPTFDGCQAVTIDRRTRSLRWVSDVLRPPATANHIHQCAQRRTPDNDPMAVGGWS